MTDKKIAVRLSPRDYRTLLDLAEIRHAGSRARVAIQLLCEDIVAAYALTIRKGEEEE